MHFKSIVKNGIEILVGQALNGWQLAKMKKSIPDMSVS